MPRHSQNLGAVAWCRRGRTVALVAAVLALPATAAAQRPWTVTISPSTTPLPSGQCTPIHLDIVDGSTGAVARGPTGGRVLLADFDMTITPAGSFVGRYDGASAWYACACPNSVGAVGTITATYPAKTLAEKLRAPSVAFASTATITATQRNNSGIPIGCEPIKTMTVQSGSAPPWSVTLASGVKAIAIGNCTAIGIDLRDASGKERPRNPAGQLVSIADFDMSASAGSGSAVAAQYDGRWAWSACGCQGSTAGAPVTITATYPAHALPDASRIRDVAFQSSVLIPCLRRQALRIRPRARLRRVLPRRRSLCDPHPRDDLSPSRYQLSLRRPRLRPSRCSCPEEGASRFPRAHPSPLRPPRRTS